MCRSRTLRAAPNRQGGLPPSGYMTRLRQSLWNMALSADHEWVCLWGARSLPVGFQNSATASDLVFYAARAYSLMRPPRTGQRLIRCWERSATG